MKSNKHNIKKMSFRDRILEVVGQAISTDLLPEKTNPDRELWKSGFDVVVTAVSEQPVLRT